MQVNILEAKTNFSKIINLVENHEEDEIIIARGGNPVAKLVRFEGTSINNRIGIAKGLFDVPDDIDSDNDEILKMFEGGIL